MERLPTLLRMHWDHEHAKVPGLLPRLLWRRGLGRGGLLHASATRFHEKVVDFSTACAGPTDIGLRSRDKHRRDPTMVRCSVNAVPRNTRAVISFPVSSAIGRARLADTCG